MDPHEVAIAALNQVAQSPHRRQPSAGNVASSRSDPNATGVDMKSNAREENAAGAQEQSQHMGGSGGTTSNAGGSQESQSSTARALQSTSSSNNSQSTADGHDGVSTPPTSTSDGFSSQGTTQDGQISQLSQLSQLAAAQQPMATPPAARPNIAVASTAGHKRTADGQVKPPSPASPREFRVRGHSRTTSAVSNISSGTSSRIGELSAELRTRLSYAMVKVNNGWQSNTIEEVESLASQAGSPTSSTSTLHGRRNHVASPRATMIALQGQNRNPMHPLMQAPTEDFDLYSRSEPSLRTYESFWRDHSSSVPPHRSYIASPPTTKAFLAPPADIRPSTNSRRSHASKFAKPPAIPGQGSNSPLNTSTPRTPIRADLREKPMQTPTQKTIQEQDAIETLLFMSSPGNSGTMGHAPFPGARPNPNLASPQPNPLRVEYNAQERGGRGAQGRRVGFEEITTETDDSSETRVERTSKLDRVDDGSREDALDRLLDEMSDASSDDEEVVLSYSPRVAAGRA